MKKKGPYKVLSSKKVYKNPWIEVREDKVERDGQKGIFGVVDYGSGVSVVALNKQGRIYLVKEYYYAIESYGLQVPSGAIDNGESPLEAAKKELLEETGFIARSWQELGFVHPLTMAIKSPAYLFLAREVEQKQEPEDNIEVVELPFEEAYQMVLKSKINHAPSCVAIMKANMYLKENGL